MSGKRRKVHTTAMDYFPIDAWHVTQNVIDVAVDRSVALQQSQLALF